MQVEICREFKYSRDGINDIDAHKGAIVDLPDHVAKGLIAEGYCKAVEDKKSLGPAPENKALFAAEENKADQPAPKRGRKPAMPTIGYEGGED